MNSSVLWIFLIAAWLFILLPMVLRGRPEVRTTDAVRNTRLLHRGGETTPRRRMAGRHPSDPDYVRKPLTTEKPAAVNSAVEKTVGVQRIVIEETVVVTKNLPPATDQDATGADLTNADAADADVTDAEVTDVLDPVSEEKPARPAGTEAADTEAADAEAAGTEAADADLNDTDVNDTEVTDVLDPVAADEATRPAGTEAPTEVIDVVAGEPEQSGQEPDEPVDAPAPRTVPRELRGRGGVTRAAVDAREARRYRERQFTAGGLLALLLLSVISCFFWQPYGYLATVTTLVLAGLYLYFLRRTAVAEQRYRTQRAARLQRHAVQDERLRRAEAAQLPVARPVAPGRRRPGGLVVLDFDDEDPAFDHLPTYDYAAVVSGGPVEDEYRRAV